MRIWTAVLPAVVAVAAISCKSREERIQEAKDDGKFLVEEKAGLVEGVGEGLKDGGKKGVEALGEGLGNVLKGAARGVDQGLVQAQVTAAKGATERGVRIEGARRNLAQETAGKIVSAYIVFDKAFTGKLLLRAIDPDGREVGRAKIDVKQEAADAAYFDFTFDERTPLTRADARFELDAL